MIGERAGYDVGIATGNREAGNVIVTCECWAGNGVASSLPAGLPPGGHLHARVLEAFLVFRRSAVFAIAGVATAALTLSACGSDSLSTTSSTTPAASGSTSASGGGVDAALAAKLPEKIKSAGVIKIGTDATYQPNEYLDADGKTVIGMDVDLFDAVAAKFGVKTEWVPSAFDSIILGVSSGKYDVGVSSFTVNADRMKEATMVSYFKAGTQWVTKKGNPKSVNPDDACGLKVAVQKGTVQSDTDLPARNKACTDAGKAEITPLVDPDQAKVTAMVQSGKADAMLVDLPPAIAAVELTNGELELLGEQYDSAPYGFVLPKSETDFGAAIVEALKAIEADGSYKSILTKWKTEGGAISDFAVNPSVG